MSKIKIPKFPNDELICEMSEGYYNSSDCFVNGAEKMRDYLKPYRSALIVAVEELNDRCYCNDCDGGTCSTCKALTRIDALLNKDNKPHNDKERGE